MFGAQSGCSRPDGAHCCPVVHSGACWCMLPGGAWCPVPNRDALYLVVPTAWCCPLGMPSGTWSPVGTCQHMPGIQQGCSVPGGALCYLVSAAHCPMGPHGTRVSPCCPVVPIGGCCPSPSWYLWCTVPQSSHMPASTQCLPESASSARCQYSVLASAQQFPVVPSHAQCPHIFCKFYSCNDGYV